MKDLIGVHVTVMVNMLPTFDWRLKTKTEGFKSLTHTGLRVGKGDLRIGTRRRDEMFFTN